MNKRVINNKKVLLLLHRVNQVFNRKSLRNSNKKGENYEPRKLER